MAAPLCPSSRKPCGSITPTRRAAGKIRECKHSAKLAPPSASTSQPSTRAHASTSSLKWKSNSPPLKHGNEELLEKREHQTAPSGGTNSTKR